MARSATSSPSSSKSSPSQMWESSGVLAASRGSRITSLVRGLKLAMRRLVPAVCRAGGFVVDLLREEQAHDLHEGDLDEVIVF